MTELEFEATLIEAVRNLPVTEPTPEQLARRAANQERLIRMGLK